MRGVRADPGHRALVLVGGDRVGRQAERVRALAASLGFDQVVWFCRDRKETSEAALGHAIDGASLVVIWTKAIGHATSNQVARAARQAAVPVVYHRGGLSEASVRTSLVAARVSVA